jgi:hypothetical protein
MLACFIQEAADDCHYYCAIHHHDLASLLKCLYNYDHGEVETYETERKKKKKKKTTVVIASSSRETAPAQLARGADLLIQ